MSQRLSWVAVITFVATAVPSLAAAAENVVSGPPSPADAGDAGPGWAVTVGGGPSLLYQGTGDRPQPVWPGPGVWYLEVQRRPSPNGLILGAALDVGPDMAAGLRGPSIDFLAAAALVGVGHRFGRAFLEGTAGLGLEAYQSTVGIQTSPEPGVAVQTNVSTFILGLHLRGQATAGLALSRSFDLLASVGGHLGTVGRRDAFLTSSVGLRLRFQ